MTTDVRTTTARPSDVGVAGLGSVPDQHPVKRGQWGLSPAAFDGAVAAMLAIALLVESVSDTSTIRPQVLLMAIPLAWRRTYPLLTFGLVLLGAIWAATYAQNIGFFCIIVAAYSVGTYSKYRLLSLAIFLATAIGVDAVYGGALPRFPNEAGPFLLLIPFWLVGMAMRARQLRAEAFEDKATRLESEQEEATQLALAEERSRIARELHDVVAHTVSVMLVQAGAARQVLTSAPEEAREALLAVEASGREAMTELRGLLGLLNQEGADVDLAPQPGIDQLDALIQRVRDAGLPVELSVEGAPAPLSVGLDLTAYRIVQEALTNSLKYSDLARTEVILSYQDDDRESGTKLLKLEILDDGQAEFTSADRGLGRGLVGMRERVSLYGGRLEAGPRLGHGYAVRVWLPLPAIGETRDAFDVTPPEPGVPHSESHPPEQAPDDSEPEGRK
jgi:signal transduction histidine kinase